MVESAAKDINRKNKLPQILPPAIFANTVGRVTKIKLGPESGVIPYVKQAGKIISPEETATNVSRQAIFTLSPKSERFLSIKLPNIAIAPIPKLSVKKA